MHTDAQHHIRGGKTQITKVATAILGEDPANARRHDAKNLKAIRDSLSAYGQVEPLIVQARTHRVIAGHGRLKVMRQLGWDACDAVIVDLDDTKARALGLALNRSGELGDWDPEALAQLLGELKGSTDLSQLGFDDKDLEAILGAEDPEPEMMEEPMPVAEVPVVARPPTEAPGERPFQSPIAQVAGQPSVPTGAQPSAESASPADGGMRVVHLQAVLAADEAGELQDLLDRAEATLGEAAVSRAVLAALRALVAPPDSPGDADPAPHDGM